VKILWEKTEGTYPVFTGISDLHVFNWQRWQWQQYFGGNPVLPFMSPFEWPEVWAGVLDVLFQDRVGSLGQILPADAIVPWTLGLDGFISIGLVRAAQLVGSEPPAWYDLRKTRWEILMES
jgi:hypothetical protein